MNVVAADPRDQSGHVLQTFKLVSVSRCLNELLLAICVLKGLQLHLHFLTYYLSLWGVSTKTGGITAVVFS